MIFEVVFTKKAQKTFDAIKFQIFNRWGEREVMKFEHRTMKVLETISNNPLIYQAVEFDETVRKDTFIKIVQYFTRFETRKLLWPSFGTTGKPLSFYNVFELPSGVEVEIKV